MYGYGSKRAVINLFMKKLEGEIIIVEGGNENVDAEVRADKLNIAQGRWCSGEGRRRHRRGTEGTLTYPLTQLPS
jgi:hypothetical protein